MIGQTNKAINGLPLRVQTGREDRDELSSGDTLHNGSRSTRSTTQTSDMKDEKAAMFFFLPLSRPTTKACALMIAMITAGR